MEPPRVNVSTFHGMGDTIIKNNFNQEVRGQNPGSFKKCEFFIISSNEDEFIVI